LVTQIYDSVNLQKLFSVAQHFSLKNLVSSSSSSLCRHIGKHNDMPNSVTV